MELPPINFRPVLPTKNSQQQPNIYRSNSLDDGTIESALWLLETIGIKSYVDLREHREFHCNSKLNHYFTFTKSNNDNIPDKNAVDDTTGYFFHIRFITFVYYLKVIMFRLSWSQLFHVFFLLGRHLFRGDYEYQRYGGSCFINPLGIGGFYCLLLDDCHHVFKTIFSLMIPRQNFPMLISCTLGKDRTGIVSALLMELVGFSNEEIVKEYAASEKLLTPMAEKIHEFFDQRGVNSEFEGSPPTAMEKMLQFLKEKYGGAEGYLIKCGLSPENIDTIKRNIQHRTIDAVT